MRHSLHTHSAKKYVAGLVGAIGLLVIMATILLLGAAEGSAAQAEPFNVGLVFDNPDGADDLSFNWMAHQGLLRAENDLGVTGTVYTPTSGADYGPLLQQCVDDGNQVCIAVGFGMAGAIWDSAEANPGADFAIADFSWESYPDNLRGMAFASEEAGYLAGTLAGLMTQSNLVGGVGGMQIPPVQAFLEPYRHGAQCTNPATRVVISYTGTFTDPGLGAQVAQGQMGQGADVVFGAAGQTGNGAILAAAQAGAWAIGVDTDQWLTVFNSGSVAGSEKLLTSAMKRIDNAVYDTVADAVADAFTPGTVLYDLSVDGVGLAPFHQADPSIPQPVRDALAAVEAGLKDGSIDPWQSCAPRSNVGLVFDSPAGVDDLSFNWMAHQGLLRAGNDLGVTGTVYTPTTEADYGPLLQQCVDDGNGLCLSVGFLMQSATWNAAQANPNVDFAIADFSWESYPDNLRGIVFASEEAGYLAGTLAGLMTQSDVVGGVGGMEIPPVQAFLEPYRHGAQHANPAARVVISYTGTFTDPGLGAQVAQGQRTQGADVVFGAAGQTGNGAILAAAQAGAWAIGVDTDQWVTVFESGSVAGSDKLLTSAMKRIDNAVYSTIADAVGDTLTPGRAAGDTFTPGTVVYGLSGDGVGLASFHEADPSIPAAVRDALEMVKAGIIDGSIDVWEPYKPYHIFLPIVVRSGSN